MASSAAAAIVAAPGLAGATIVPPSSATLQVVGDTVTATLSGISTDLPGGTVQCTLFVDGDPRQNTLSAREPAPANFTLARPLAAGEHLALTYCADFPADSDTPSSYPTLACAKVTMPVGTVEALPNDQCFLTNS
ncbi:hypothetical protein [Nocardia tenerifensis]|uniref:hypothetical protein n=1 Tax=Nocardia tenerifensis TaxID=228006 RepID=UPI0011B5E4F9|nr:hypothetical protein [Nocardia tenerifensis]